jgi:hypothetical protein
MPRRVLVRKELKARKGIPWSRQHLKRKVDAGEFPPPWSPPGSSLNFWFEDVIDTYLEASATGGDWRVAVSKLELK